MPKAIRMLPSAEYLRECFIYNAETGELRRRKNGRIITSKTPKGYLQFRLGAHNVYVSRVVYKMHHGIDPEWIDHKDGNRVNNRLENLRSVTMRESNRNMLKRPGAAGYTGVFLRKGLVYGKPFKASIRDQNGKRRYLGVFDTAEEAHAAYVAAANEIFGEYSPFRR